MERKSRIATDFENILGMKKHFSKFISENMDGQYPPAFCMFAEALDRQDFTSQQELSDFLDVNKAHTSRTLVKMHTKGLIKLEPKKISLTKKGKEFAQITIENKNKIINSLLSGISDEDLEALSRIVNQIIENTKKIEQE